MSFRKMLLATAISLSAIGSVQAEVSKALQARSVDLGGLQGVAYYTSEPDGYRVVVTLARHESVPAVRFETTLVPGQEAVVSVPRELGVQAQALKIRRTGDDVIVRQWVQETAAAE